MERVKIAWIYKRTERRETGRQRRHWKKDFVALICLIYKEILHLLSLSSSSSSIPCYLARLLHMQRLHGVE
jgi:hypothetical protein